MAIIKRKRLYAPRNLSPREKLDFLSMPEPNSGCLLWIGAANADDYGHIWLDGRLRRATRVVWEIERGPIPTGMNVLHKCDVPACIEIKHLFLGTQQDNINDMIAKGRKAVRSSAPRILCPSF